MIKTLLYVMRSIIEILILPIGLIRSWIYRKLYLMKLKDNIVYNQPNNQVMVKTDGNKIVIICNTEEDLDKVHKRFSKRNTNTFLVEYEEWDEGEDKKYIVTYEIKKDDRPFLN